MLPGEGGQKPGPVGGSKLRTMVPHLWIWSAAGATQTPCPRASSTRHRSGVAKGDERLSVTQQPGHLWSCQATGQQPQLGSQVL